VEIFQPNCPMSYSYKRDEWWYLSLPKYIHFSISVHKLGQPRPNWSAATSPTHMAAEHCRFLCHFYINIHTIQCLEVPKTCWFLFRTCSLTPETNSNTSQESRLKGTKSFSRKNGNRLVWINVVYGSIGSCCLWSELNRLF